MKRREDIDRDVGKEIEFHIDMRSAELEGEGLDPQRARTEARRAFGDRRRIHQECKEITRAMSRKRRAGQMLDTIALDVRFAARTLLRDPTFSVVAILTLALGIGANTAIFSVVNGVLLRPLPYPEADRIVSIWERNAGGGDNHIAWPNAVDWRDRGNSFATLAVHPSYAFGGPTTVLGGDTPARLRVASVSRGFFDVMGTAAHRGRVLAAAEHVQDGDAVAVVSHAFWLTQLGGIDDLGARRLRASSADYEIVGVMPPGFRFPADTDVWIATERFGNNNSRTAHNWAAVGRLREGVDLEEARAELDAMTAGLKEQFGADMNAVGVNMRLLQDELVGSTRRPLYLLLGAAGLVLLVACSNLASTLLARGSSRQREVAIRSSLGARRGRLVWQMLTESTLLTAAGTAAGLLAAQGVLSGLLALGPTLPRIEEIRLDGAVMLFTAAVAILTAAVAGLFPALRASRSEAADTLRSGGRSSAGDRRSLPWQLLVSTEVAMALILLIGAGLLIRSFSAIVGIDSGIDPRGVLTVDISVPRANHPDDPSLISFYSRLLNEIESLPGVEGAGIINHLPFSDMWMNGGFMIEGVGEAPGYAHYRAVSGGYFDAMGIPMLRGRSFTAGDQAGGPGVVVVNEAFADAFFPGEEALGKRIGNLANDQWAYGDEWLTIVGVAGNVRHTGLTEPAPGAVYVNAMQRPMQARAAVLAVKATGSVSLAGSVRARLREIDPDVPVAISSMDAVLGRSTADRRFLMLVLGSFSTVALVLATVGIYGVVSYAVARRTREMGIRIALGAEPGKVRALVIRNSMGMVAAGIAMGAVGALLLSGLLRNLVFEISPSDPLTFVLVTVLLAGAALLASYVPALRGSRVDPMVTMRSE